jgi:hypothetical protein
MGMRECVTCHSHARLVAIREASFADEWAHGEAEVCRGCQWMEAGYVVQCGRRITDVGSRFTIMNVFYLVQIRGTTNQRQSQYMLDSKISTTLQDHDDHMFPVRSLMYTATATSTSRLINYLPPFLHKQTKQLQQSALQLTM